MPCFSPLTAWKSVHVNPSGKRGITFKLSEAFVDQPLELPCGQCVGCRLERSRQWAVRCVHEASLHESNCFITLTFDNSHLKPSLCKRDFVLFMKRLRKQFGEGIRFFHCGEYGEINQRPHHHACLFGFDFPDKELWSVRQGVRLFRSAALERLWPFGFSTIGDVTFQSAAYVARYIMKKVTGPNASAHYQGRIPEYITMSRRPGLAAEWIKKFHKDVYPADRIILNEKIKCRPPKYYDKIYDEVIDKHGNLLEDIKCQRRSRAADDPHSAPDRLQVRRKVQEARLKKLIRDL